MRIRQIPALEIAHEVVGEQLADLRTEIGMARLHRPQRLDDVGLTRLLEHVAAHADLQGAKHVRLVRMHAHHDDLDLGHRVMKTLRRVDAVEMRHAQVEQQHVGPLVLDHLQHTETVAPASPTTSNS